MPKVYLLEEVAQCMLHFNHLFDYENIKTPKVVIDKPWQVSWIHLSMKGEVYILFMNCYS